MSSDDEMGGEPPCLLPMLDEEGRVPDGSDTFSSHIKIKRAYDAPDDGDGYRVLVDRIWPRGVRREAAHLDAWLKEIAPSTELRKWFGHDPAKWEEFQARYRAELEAPERREALNELLEHARRGVVTLVYGARDTMHNNAMALRNLLIAGKHQ